MKTRFEFFRNPQQLNHKNSYTSDKCLILDGLEGGFFSDPVQKMGCVMGLVALQVSTVVEGSRCLGELLEQGQCQAF